MSEPLVTHLFVEDPRRASDVRATLASSEQLLDVEVVVHESIGHVVVVASDARAKLGGLPLAFLVATESSVLDALSGGADDAAVLDTFEPAKLRAFLDRVMLRARMRRENERVAESVAQADKLTALGTLVAGIGHEINNPLSAISLSVEAARRVLLPVLSAAWELDRAARASIGLSEEEVARLAATVRFGRRGLEPTRLLDDMASATSHIADIVGDLRIFARSDAQERPVLVDIADVVDQAVRLVGREISRHGVLERDIPPGLPPLVVPRTRLIQVLTNLLVNAAHAIVEVERPMHRVRITARADDDFVAISMVDTGPGIPADAVERIFDPFFTTKRQETGTGLGLAISRSILRRLGGDLVVDSIYGEGATFVCTLPRPSGAVLRAASTEPVTKAPLSSLSSSLSVLVVDDDERVLRALARYLSPRFRVLLARDGLEAIDLLRSGSHADVVVTELDLPELDGFGLLDWLTTHAPALAAATVFATAAGDDPRYAARLGERTVLEKPLRAEALVTAVEAAHARGLAAEAPAHTVAPTLENG